MKLPFTSKVTGWFMIGWSPKFPAGEVRPLRCFGEDRAAYRSTTSVPTCSTRSGGHESPTPPTVPPGELRRRIEKQFLPTVWDNLQIWRYQRYVERPPLSKADAKGYMALRKWATQFYEVPA